MQQPASGRCQCGGIRYTVQGEPLMVYACHCHECQRRTGSAFSMGLMIGADALSLAGDLVAYQRVSDAGGRNTRYSCAGCGNIIYGEGDSAPGLLKLQPGTLDETADIEPEVHIWTGSRQRWFRLPEGVPSYEGQPEEAVELLQAALAYRAKKADGQV